MARSVRSFMVGLAAAFAVATIAADASASTGLSVVNGVSSASARGALTFGSGALSYLCNVTLGIALNPSIAKTSRSAIGQILDSSAGSGFSGCNAGMVGTVLDGATLEYSSFMGTLPEISAVDAVITDVAISLVIPFIGQECLYTGTINARMIRTAFTGIISTIRLVARSSLTAPIPCPSPLSLNGMMTVQGAQPIVQLI